MERLGNWALKKQERIKRTIVLGHGIRAVTAVKVRVRIRAQIGERAGA